LLNDPYICNHITLCSLKLSSSISSQSIQILQATIDAINTNFKPNL